jgi:hypothetical protein
MMEFELSWIDPTLIRSRTWGVASVEGFEAVYKAIVAESRFRPGVKLLSDHRDLDGSGLSGADVEKIAAVRGRYAELALSPSAIVVGSDSPLKYGLARVFGAYASTGEGAVLVRVFETTDEAMAWLDELDESPDETGS